MQELQNRKTARVVNVRELARHASQVVNDVASRKRPTFVTKRGRIAVVVMPVSEEELEDYVLANAPEYVDSMREANAALAAGDVVDAFAYDPHEQQQREVKDIDRMLDLWIESLDHYISTGSPMTLSAARTTGLRRVLNQLRDERQGE